jgi:hypothetical protein
LTSTLDSCRRVQFALSYLDRGWSVLPLQAGGKKPHFGALERVNGTTDWSLLRQRPASKVEVRAWYEHDPYADLGVILGNGHLVFDVDHPARARALRHPPTPCVRTGRGWHLHFSTDPSRATPTRRFNAGELRGEGSYVKAPPSIHESGVEYEWRIPLDDVPLAPIEALSDRGQSLFPPSHTEAGVVPQVEALPQAEVLLPTVRGEVAAGADQLAQSDAAVSAALVTMGVNVPLGRKFRCVLPGHGPDADPSASLLRGRDGVWRYFDHHRRAEPPTLTLAEVRASRGAGQVVRLKGPSQARWYRRLFYEAGFIPARVPRLVLPDGTSPVARRVGESFALLLALRESRGWPGAPFTPGFAAAWSGMSESQASGAIKELRGLGVFIVCGQHGRMNLYEFAKGCRGCEGSGE